jgi:hypothetical protein
MEKWGLIFTFHITSSGREVGVLWPELCGSSSKERCITGRGNARQRIFADEKDCAKFVQLLVESIFPKMTAAYRKNSLTGLGQSDKHRLLL